MVVRKAQDRGQFDHGWLKTAHTFSFGEYYDQNHMGFGCLRVINDDVVSPSKGFDTHGHKNMEIVTYVISGSLAHKDSMGNVRTVNAGEWQVMSAGTGVRHSEFNPSDEESVHLLQIWIIPERPGLIPSYDELKSQPRPGLNLVAAPKNASGEGVLVLNQDAYIKHLWSDGTNAVHRVEDKRALWLHCAVGEVRVNDTSLRAGDGLAVTTSGDLKIVSSSGAQALLFDLPLEPGM